MNFNYCIVQAGGKGTRLKHLTRNRPKCLVPYDNLPILFHLFRQFPDKKFIVIGDYKYEILERYLESFAGVRYVSVRAFGQGTCSGIKQALDLVPPNTPFLLTWSDIVLCPALPFEKLNESNYIGISNDFECRWSFIDGKFAEIPSKENGVAGVFLFNDKDKIAEVPDEGEFVRFLSGSGIVFSRFSLEGSRELGRLDDISRVENAFRCRPFNRIRPDGDTLVKIPIDEYGKKLAVRERNWYREAIKHGYRKIPEILSLDPLIMKRVDGCNIYQAELDDERKKRVIDNITASLEELHELAKSERDVFSIKEAYYTKTIDRIEKVRGLIPFTDRKEIRINGKNCRNIYFCYDKLRELTGKLLYDAPFAFIHGDCTFSNMMIDKNLDLVLIDPRGYFGFTEIFGDTAYDWAKVYYSINGNYDQFNNHNFSLEIRDDEIILDIASNGWEHLSGYYLSKISCRQPEKIKLIHALIWISLTTYAWEDYDSVCGAFYKGLLVFDDFFRSLA